MTNNLLTKLKEAGLKSEIITNGNSIYLLYKKDNLYAKDETGNCDAKKIAEVCSKNPGFQYTARYTCLTKPQLREDYGSVFDSVEGQDSKLIPIAKVLVELKFGEN